MTKNNGKNNVIIENFSYDLLPIGELDITNDWVVIEPMNYSEKFRTLENLVVQANGGFGCRGAALSLHGGKVFCTDSKGGRDTVYRSDIAGLATKEMLESLGIKNTVEATGDLWL